jgi:hypothetical protein
MSADIEEAREFQRKATAEAQAAYTIEMIDLISKNTMPPCFEADRAAFVALAQLLMSSLNQTEALLAKRRH